MPDSPSAWLRSLAAEATPGPWKAGKHADTVREVVRRLSGTGDVPAIDFALDALLAEVERLTGERNEARTEWKRWVRLAAIDTERAEAAEALAERRGAAATLARSELDWCIGYASTVEHKAWRERLLKRLHVARAALARLSAGKETTPGFDAGYEVGGTSHYPPAGKETT